MRLARILKTVDFLVALLAAASPAAPILGPITFGPGDYDNTVNTVTAGPVTHLNQTTGLFRDVFWWSINNGNPRVGSPDFINQGNSLVLSANHAVPGPGPYKSLNFTGPSISGGQSYLAVYDTTPADGATTRNLFDASAGTLEVSADVLFVKHDVVGGVVAFYSEGQDGLFLVAGNRDGNNTDIPRLGLVWQSNGSGITLESATLPASTFVPGNWYRVVLDVDVSGGTWTANGTLYNHLAPTDPTSGLGSLITTLSHTGSLLDPDNGPALQTLSNPGEVGILAMGRGSISLPDNVGVSVTNFQVSQVPEPWTAALLGLPAIVLVGRAIRRRGA